MDTDAREQVSGDLSEWRSVDAREVTPVGVPVFIDYVTKWVQEQTSEKRIMENYVAAASQAPQRSRAAAPSY